MTRMKAIQQFFSADGGRSVHMDEMKALTSDDRKELATLAAHELGVTLDEAVAA